MSTTYFIHQRMDAAQTYVGVDSDHPLPVYLAAAGVGAVTTRDSYAAAVTITRPANQTPYTAVDVVGATAAAITFPSMGPSGKEILITSVSLEIDTTAIPSGMTSFKLALYSVTPPSALADNAPWDLPSGDRASFLGIFSLGTPVDLGSTLYVEISGVNKQVTLAGTNLFGYLITDGGFTPAANSEVYRITLHSVAV